MPLIKKRMGRSLFYYDYLIKLI